MKIKKDIELKHLTTFQVGGKARYLVEVDKDEEVVEAFEFAKKEGVPIFVLGEGSDVLVSDKNFDGLVLRHIGKNIKFKEKDGGAIVCVDGGVRWDDLVKESVKRGLQGIETMSGIPGSVGAAPIQNIGAYGQELEDTFFKLRAFDFQKKKFVEMDKETCDFSYRDSIFKKKENSKRYFITKVCLKLKKGKKAVAVYNSLKEELEKRKIKNPTTKDARKAVLSLRGRKLEDSKVIGNAGSFFKNPFVDKKEVDRILKKYPDLVFFEKDGKYKLFSGWLIERAGWKGMGVGNARVSDKNALVLTNRGKATAKDIKKLSEKISEDVFAKFGVKLEPEVRFVNF